MLFIIDYLYIAGADTPVLSNALIYAEDIEEAIDYLEEEYPNLYKILRAKEVPKGILQ